MRARDANRVQKEKEKKLQVLGILHARDWRDRERMKGTHEGKERGKKGQEKQRLSQLCAVPTTNISSFSSHDSPPKRLTLDPF